MVVVTSFIDTSRYVKIPTDAFHMAVSKKQADCFLLKNILLSMSSLAASS